MSSQQAAGGERELVYCHSCENEWYRDEHGLVCPQCQSDAVEIIEADHDPRQEMHEEATPSFGLFGNNFAGSGIPGLHPAEPEGSDVRWFTRPDGTRVMQQTRSSYTRGPPPAPGSQQRSTDPNIAVMNILSGLINSIGGMTPDQAVQQSRLGHADESRNIRSFPSSPAPPVPTSTRPDLSGVEEGASGSAVPGQPTTQSSVRRFQYGPFRGTFQTSSTIISNGRVVHSSSSNSSMPSGNPFQQDPDLGGILQNFMTPMGQRQGHGGPPVFVRIERRGGGGAGGDGMPGEPMGMGAGLGGILQALGMMAGDPSRARMGDYAFSDEALHRLMEQLNEGQQSNAPGPASAEAIAALPRIKMTKEMIGEDRETADCGICMDEVPEGEEVVQLPCKHWYHFDCVQNWLKEHDSCPSCRRGIMARDEDRPRTTGEAPRNWHNPSGLSRQNTNDSQAEGGDAAATTATADTGAYGGSLDSSWGTAGIPATTSPSTQGRPPSRHDYGPRSPNSAGRSGGGSSVLGSAMNGILNWMGRHATSSGSTTAATAGPPRSFSASTGSRSSTTGHDAAQQRTHRRPSASDEPPSTRRRPNDHSSLEDPDVD